MADKFTLEEEGYFSTSRIIVYSFISIIVLLFVYLYFANQALIRAGLHKQRSYGKKSKKGKTFWSYGD